MPNQPQTAESQANEADKGSSRFVRELVAYYSEAGPDYEAWSKAFNMHFGFYRWPMNPFALEPMLERMNREVLDRLDLPADSDGRLLDMGCGLGATTRAAARRFPRVIINGISIVPWQLEQAEALTQTDGDTSRIHYLETDYTRTPFTSQTFDGIWALESACHAQGLAKADFLSEAHRLLKPGHKLVIADGFLKSKRRLNPLLRYCLKKTCACWSLETFAGLAEFEKTLGELGFRDIRVEEISYRIAPSVLHVPWVTLKFLCGELFVSKKKMTRKRWDNVLAPTLGIPVGLARRSFGYYLITATR